MNNIDHQYIELCKDILKNGTKKEDRTGTGTISVFGRQIRHNMSLGFPLLTTKRVAWNSIAKELLWFMRGETNIRELIKDGCNIWNGDSYKKYSIAASAGEVPIKYMKADTYAIHSNDYNPFTLDEFRDHILHNEEFAKKWGELGPVYGKQWRDCIGIDQLKNTIQNLKSNPFSRRHIVNSWSPSEIPSMTLPPCHYAYQFNVRPSDNGNMLSLMVNIRSSDVPLGLPFNIASYGLLLEIVSRMVGMKADELVINLGDTHIYLNQIEGIKEQLNREPKPLPELSIKSKINKETDLDQFLDDASWTDFKIKNYSPHSTIKYILSN